MKILSAFLLPAQNRSAGATALEFALILPVLLLLIIGITAYGIVIYGEATLEAAVDVAAREGKTGFACGGSQTAYIQGLVNNIIGDLLVPGNLQVYAVPFSSWTITPNCSTNTATQCTNTPGTPANLPTCNGTNGSPPCPFNLGNQGQVVEYTFVYPWAIVPHFLNNVIGNNGIVNLTASAVVQNEPYSSTNSESIATTNINNAACP